MLPRYGASTKSICLIFWLISKKEGKADETKDIGWFFMWIEADIGFESYFFCLPLTEWEKLFWEFWVPGVNRTPYIRG